MAFLSPVELVRLGFVRPELRDKLDQLMAAFEAATGRKTYVSDNGGARSSATQAAIYADSLTEGFRAAPAGHSMHEFGAAFDLHIVGESDDAAKDQASPAYEKLAQLAESLGLRAGKRFKTGKPDPYHFELPETLSDARAKWDALTRGRLWRGVIVAAVVVVGWLALRKRHHVG